MTDTPSSSWLLLLLTAGALAATVPFRPGAALRSPALRLPWIASLGLLVLLWAVQLRLPAGTLMSLSGASLLVLMFGWPLALWTLAATAALAGLLQAIPVDQLLGWLWWRGLLPASLALLIGLATRRWLPHHLFVYILARAFIGTAVAVVGAGSLEILLSTGPDHLRPGERWVGHWLMAWGEATATGMLVAVFVAFKPQWLLTYSDLRYLPPRPPVE